MEFIAKLAAIFTKHMEKQKGTTDNEPDGELFQMGLERDGMSSSYVVDGDRKQEGSGLQLKEVSDNEMPKVKRGSGSTNVSFFHRFITPTLTHTEYIERWNTNLCRGTEKPPRATRPGVGRPGRRSEQASSPHRRTRCPQEHHQLPG